MLNQHISPYEEQKGKPMPLVDAGREDGKTLSILLGLPFAAAFGLAIFRIGAWTAFRIGPGASDGGISFFAHLVQALAIVALIILDRKFTYTRKTLLRALCIVAFLGAVASAAIMSPSTAIAYAGSALHGAASAFIVLGFGLYFCSLSPAKSSFGLTFAFAIYGITTWILSFIPSSLIALISVACFPLSYFCIYISFGKDAESIARKGGSTMTSLSELPWIAFALLAVCAIASMVAQVIVPVTDELLSSPYSIYWPAILIGIFLLYAIWIVLLKHNRVENLWLAFVLVIFSGLLCWSSFSDVHQSFAANFFRATRECLMLFCWIVVAEIAYSRNLPRIASFGTITLVLLSLPKIITSASEWLFPGQALVLPRAGTVLITTVVSFILIIVAFAVLLKQTKRTIVVTPKAEESTTPNETSFAAFSAQFGLTHREEEVLALLSKGHTLPSIAERLCISLDTVRSHAKNIYRKAGVHKKQELLNLLEAMRTDGKARQQDEPQATT